MTLERETRLALELLRDDRELIDDARFGAKLGNSVAGSLLGLTYGIPRQYAEAAVVLALKKLDDEQGGAQ
jgi:hypothetical protein